MTLRIAETSASETSVIPALHLPRKHYEHDTKGFAKMDISALATRAPKPSPQAPVRRPHVVRVIGPFFPVWCTAVVSGSFPTPDYITTPKNTDKGPAQSDTTGLLRPK